MIDFKNTNTLACISLLALLGLQYVRASGIDTNAYAKTISVKYFPDLTVDAQIDPDGNLDSLTLTTSDKKINVPKNELMETTDVDLQSLKVRYASDSMIEKNPRLLHITFEHGKEIAWQEQTAVKGSICVKSVTKFVFSSEKYHLRYTSTPRQKAGEWDTYSKVVGKPKGDKEGAKGLMCPLLIYAKVQIEQ